MIRFFIHHPIIAVMLLLLVIYIFICVGYFILHRFFIFHPSSILNRLPSDFGMAYKEFFINSYDQTRLQLWLIPGSLQKQDTICAKFTLLFFPGNEGTLSKFLPAMKALHDQGFTICMFSYRGFGKSDKKRPFEKALQKDCTTVWAFLCRELKCPPGSIIIFGQSIGCGLAAFAAAQFNPGGLILEGAFPSVAEITKHYVPWLPVKWLTTERFNTQAFIPDIHCPVLVAHSRDDQAIPITFGKQLYALIKTPRQFITLSGEHAKGLETDSQIFIQAIQLFINQVEHFFK